MGLQVVVDKVEGSELVQNTPKNQQEVKLTSFKIIGIVGPMIPKLSNYKEISLY